MAYADFVTAMMAFFMLMWLLNATTEKQRKGIADYFNPTIPLNRISGGGDGAFGGDTIFSEETLTTTGTGASLDHVSDQDKARGQSGTAEQQEQAQAEKEAMAQVAQALMGKTGESNTMERLMRHVVTKVTDVGLVIEIFDVPDSPLFAENSADPLPLTRDIAGLLAEVLALAENQIAVEGYVRAYPITLIDNPSWDLSAERAQVMRALLESKGLTPQRISRITGHADRQPATADPSAMRNNRLEIILLRRDR